MDCWKHYCYTCHIVNCKESVAMSGKKSQGKIIQNNRFIDDERLDTVKLKITSSKKCMTFSDFSDF